MLKKKGVIFQAYPFSDPQWRVHCGRGREGERFIFFLFFYERERESALNRWVLERERDRDREGFERIYLDMPRVEMLLSVKRLLATDKECC